MAKAGVVLNPAKIKVIGLGGGGCNAVTRMVREEIRGVDFVAMNTDAQAIAIAEAPIRLQLGEKLTRGLGVGGDHHFGEKAAEESADDIRAIVHGADMVFITAGMGGGTGTGSAPVVAAIAKQAGALTIAIVTKPFSFEGNHRARVAEAGIANLLEKCDTVIMIPNDRLLGMCDQKTSVDGAFKMADDVLRSGIQAISEVITVPGLINLDFADIKAIMRDAGPAWMSVGVGVGQNRAVEAAKEALSSPLLDVSLAGARGVLFNVVGGNSMTLFEVNAAAEIIRNAVDPEANIIFGVAHDENMDKEVRITLVATGFASAGSSVNDGPAMNVEEVQALNELKDSEDAMDAPSFTRSLFGRRRQIIPAAGKVEKITDKAVVH